MRTVRRGREEDDASSAVVVTAAAGVDRAFFFADVDGAHTDDAAVLSVCASVASAARFRPLPAVDAAGEAATAGFAVAAAAADAAARAASRALMESEGARRVRAAVGRVSSAESS